MIRKFGWALAAAVSLAGIGAASAADMAVKARPLPPPVYSWTGCYIDGGIGYGLLNQDRFGETFPGLVQLTGEITSGGRGWLGRVGGGCDYQFAGPFGANWVIGILGDYDFMSVKSRTFADVAGRGAEETQSSAWYIGGRIGWLVQPQLLTFFSAGYTQTRFDAQTLFATVVPVVPTGQFVDEHTYSGWFVGGGVEYALNWFPGLNWKTEYRFAQYRAEDLPILLANGRFSGLGEHSEKFVQTVTSSLVWRFNSGAPLARY